MIQLKKFILPLTVLIGLLSPVIVLACIWDYDTIKMERSRFPSVLELITGKFLRHSPEFYEWRIKDRLKRLENDPTNVNLLDDLAVAYDKTGQHDKAIETALNTEKIKSDRYETLSNLGTFYFHAGKLAEGLPYIDKALKINPDAHFGREKYQKFLAEYVLQQRKDDISKLPLADKTITETQKIHNITNTYKEFLDQKLYTEHIKSKENETQRSHRQTPEEISKAIKGVLGMMRFGSYDSPILLEALGSLLSPANSPSSRFASHLACRAYLKASYARPEGSVRIAYQEMAARVLNGRSEQLEKIKPLFKKELEEAQEWYAKLRENELSWIRDGKNPEVEFDKLYDADPELSGGLNFYDKNKVLVKIIGICLTTIVSIICIKLIKKRRAKSK